MALAVFPWQKHLADTLNGMRGKLPNGLLIYGPRGIGTFELVHAFAKSLMCTSPAADGTSCGHCKGCHLTASYAHPDLVYVVSEAEALPRDIPFEEPDNAASDRKTQYREILIHQTRRLAEIFSLKTNEGGLRVVLVYPADQLRAEAAAALLKNLEEPPENTVFLLVADGIDFVLPTIRSRCRLLRADMPTHAEALAWLEHEHVDHPEKSLALAGGMPLAVFEKDVKRIVTDEQREKLLAFLRAGRREGADAALNAVTRDMTLQAVSVFLSRWAWDLAAAFNGAAPRYFTEEGQVLREIAQGMDAAKLFMWINSVRDVCRVSDHPLSPKLILEALLLAYLRAIAPAAR